MQDAKQWVKGASKQEVEEAVEERAALKGRLARVYANNKAHLANVAGMTAEVVGGLAGGAVVGAMRAYDVEEFGMIAAAGLGGIAGLKRLQEPMNPYYQAAFATSVGMGAALIAGVTEEWLTEEEVPKAA